MAKVVNLIRKEEAASGNLTITKSKHDIAKEIDDLVKFEQALALRMVRADQISASYLSMDDANLSASLGVAWPSWQDFFNAIIVDNDIKVDSWTRAWFQVSYLSELKDMLAVHLTEVNRRKQRPRGICLLLILGQRQGRLQPVQQRRHRGEQGQVL